MGAQVARGKGPELRREEELTPKPVPVYLVFGNKVVKALDTQPSEPGYRCNGRYRDDQGQLIRAASAATLFLSLRQAEAYYHTQIIQCQRNIKAYEQRLAAIEAEMAKEAKGEG